MASGIFPPVASDGTWALIWYKPGSPGARPIYKISVGRPPITTQIDWASHVDLPGITVVLSPPDGGFTAPKPVKYIAMTSPRRAGFASVTTEKSVCRIAPAPAPV